MRISALLAAIGAVGILGCTEPNPDYMNNYDDKPVPAETEFVDDPAVDGPLEVELMRGESLGDNPGEIGDEWNTLKTTVARQWISFSAKSGVAGSSGDSKTMNFSGGSKPFKYSLAFDDGIDFSTANYVQEKGTFVMNLDLRVNIAGEDCRMDAVEFNRSTREMWLYFSSVTNPGKTMVVYDDDVHSDKYSKRKSTVNGVVMKNWVVTITADLEAGRLTRMNVDHQLFPMDNLNIRSCESLSDHVDPYSLIGLFDIYHKGRTDCSTKPAYNALVADTTKF